MIEKKVFLSGSGLREAFALISPDDGRMSPGAQLKRIADELSSLLGSEEFSGLRPVMKRWFLSDAANQKPLLPKETECAVSVVEQPPLSRVKAVLWVWLMEGVDYRVWDDGLFTARLGGFTHVFETGLGFRGNDSGKTMEWILSAADASLRGLGGTLAGNCVRTWFYVRDIDVDYRGMAEGRNRVFERCGLTSSTHFIASTGIGGASADPAVRVLFDAYSVIGLGDDAVKYISVPERMNPTHEYGVAFERASTVDYPDRRHLFVSGTASIDHHGEIVCEGDVAGQTRRMIGNVDALLEKAGFSRDDIGYCFVYLRDMADYETVDSIIAREFPDTPYVILLARVCRPGWLVEMECMAVKGKEPDKNP